MTSTWIDCCFVRGGTSKGLFFRYDALPDIDPTDAAARAEKWDPLLSRAMGSPDAHERQLDGMGGGISSLSKVMVVGASTREGIDLDYTFGQVDVLSPTVDYAGNCGNLSAGVVPFALETGLLTLPDGPAEVRLFNTNTGKRVTVRLTVEGGRAAIQGDCELPGVSGTSSPIELVYPDPAGSRTAGLLPTGNAQDDVDFTAPDGTERSIRTTLIDATLPLVIVNAADVELSATEAPGDIDAQTDAMATLDAIRRAGAVTMGMCDTPDQAPLMVPKIAMIAPPADQRLLDGSTLAAADMDFTMRTISMNKCHKAVPGTGAMCLAAAAHTPGTLLADLLSHQSWSDGALRIGTPSGAVLASAAPGPETDLAETSLIRTARILMRGAVAV